MEFPEKVLMIGYGAVAQCALPLILKHLKIPPANVTVIDFVDKRAQLAQRIKKGLRFVQEKVTPLNLTKVLSTHVSKGGLVIDLAWNIDCFDIITWCHDNEVFYLSTSVEEWDPYAKIQSKSAVEKSLYSRYVKLYALARQWKGSRTVLLDHGANPGLVSHFARQGLADIAQRLAREKKVSRKSAAALEALLAERDFAGLAMKLGVKVIHCSERDTQITRTPKRKDEFVGVWCIEGMREEGISPVELGWGTHEKRLPDGAMHPGFGPGNQIVVPRMGINTWVHSWVPSGEIVGMLITHGEAFGLSYRLQVCDKERVVYRPTVLYAYMPCNETIASLQELRCRNYDLQPNLRIMTDEITDGEDTLGVLLMGHPYTSWWTGSILGIQQSRKLVPGQNATTLQVATGVVCGAEWLLKNPDQGLCFPEDLPHDAILARAKRYLGDFVSAPSEWTPLRNNHSFFLETARLRPAKDPWQFANFVFRP